MTPVCAQEYKARLAASEAQARVAQQHSEETANSLQALMGDIWALKHENTQVCQGKPRNSSFISSGNGWAVRTWVTCQRQLHG